MTITQDKSKYYEVVAWALGGSLLAGTILFFDRSSALLWKNICDAAHVLLSGVVGLVMLRVSRILLSNVAHTHWIHYFLSLVGVLFVGGTFELFQALGLGDPSWIDLGRDMAGGASVIAISYSVNISTKRLRWVVIVASVVGMMVAIIRNLIVVGSLAYQYHFFPVLADFEDSWQKNLFVVTGSARLSLVSLPSSIGGFTRGYVGKMEFLTGSTPIFRLFVSRGDWSHYSHLKFRVYSTVSKPVPVTLGIEDNWHERSYQHHYNNILSIQPGPNRLSIPIDEINSMRRDRLLDKTNMVSLYFHQHEPKEESTLYIDDISLE